ncbi:helicase HerA-like domain-containing protein [Quadrisphaera sp. KR29]|uniref:helicase HerA-like domain-containing protein n=1 Tax=Quadrisphaera sp. KR29 TaxID=3461391 RepID=UPI004045109A
MSTSEAAGTTAFVDAVRAAYATSGAAVHLGALVVDGAAHPEAPVQLPLSVLNRHGLVAGATGTGKTKTLQLVAEQLSAHGVPTFLTDVKGDLSGIALPGQASDRVTSRAADVGQRWTPAGCPTELLALGGIGTGVPVRATITSFGPALLARVLDLSEVQSSSLALVFHWADRAGLPLLDLADLRAVISHLVSAEGKADLEGLGGLSKQTAGVLLRELLAFADGGADAFFGEPELDVHDLLRTVPAEDGTGGGERGVVSCLELPAVQGRPALFSTFLLWLLAELFEELPEVGDLEKPRLVFFFDEAHLLFTGASKDFVAQVAQTVRLVRSKGVGVVFVTQSPTDLPREVLAQLGSRVQHALRAFTPEDAKALRATASTYPRSDHYDVEGLLTSVGTGEAVVTVLSESGVPTPVAWTRLRAPQSLMAPAPQAEQQRIVAASPLQAEYGTPIDRDSAYERLTRKTAAPPRAAGQQREPSPSSPEPSRVPSRRRAEPEERSVVEQVLGSSAFRSFARSAASSLGREITRSIFGVRRR